MIKFSHSVFALPFALAVGRAGRAGRRVHWRAAALDRGGHGRRAQRGHGLQPPGRPGDRRAATRAPRAASCRGACSRAARCGCSCSLSAAGARGRGRDAQPALPRPLAGGARARARLLVHQALHVALAPRARPGARDRARRRLARRPRRASTAAPVVLGLAVLSWVAGFDTHLLLPGRRVRPAGGPALAARRLGMPRALWSRAGSARRRPSSCCRALRAGPAPPALPGRAWRRVAVLLVYEHSLVRADDLSRVTRLFTVNGWISSATSRRRSSRRAGLTQNDRRARPRMPDARR